MIKKISGKTPPRPGIGIKDGNGVMLYEMDSIKQRWYDYGKQLFSSRSISNPPNDQSPGELEPEVMLGEIRAAIKKLKNDKAAGLDGIYGEMIKAGGDTVVQAMKTIIDQICKTVIGQVTGPSRRSSPYPKYQEHKTAPNIEQSV